MGLLDTIYKNIPLQVRTFAEKVAGDRSPITNENLSDADRNRMLEAIYAARQNRQGLLEKFPTGVKTDPEAPAIEFEGKPYNIDLREYSEEDLPLAAQYLNLFPQGEESIKSFKEGKGTVNYHDYYTAGQADKEDLTIGPSGSIRNTFGQFRYETTPEGNLKVIDLPYDFEDDYIQGEMPKEVAMTDRYNNLSNLEKAKLVAKETFAMPQQGFDLGKGFKTLPSRIGNAYIGRDGSPVDVQFPIDIEALKRIRGY